ncbi:MAG: hypothetical protein GY930_12680 [bacterium]|nr:hypothetical protein [bacterium]
MSQPKRTRPIHTPPGGEPIGIKPNEAIIEAIGQEGVFRILANVYKRLETASIRPLFAADLDTASWRAASYFVEAMGGRHLYSDSYGRPLMRERHLPIEIDEAARVEWLDCFKAALRDDIRDYNFPAEHLESMETYSDLFSKWMVNVESEA